MSLQIEARDLANSFLPANLEPPEILELSAKANDLITSLQAEAERQMHMSAFARSDIYECIRRLNAFDMHLKDLMQSYFAKAALLSLWEQEKDREGKKDGSSKELDPPIFKIKKHKR